MKKGKPYTRRRATVGIFLGTGIIGLSSLWIEGCENSRNARSVALNDESEECRGEVYSVIKDEDLSFYTPPQTVQFVQGNGSAEQTIDPNADFITKLGELGVRAELVVANTENEVVFKGISPDQYQALDPTTEITQQLDIIKTVHLLPPELISVLRPRVRFISSLDRAPYDPLRGGAIGTIDGYIDRSNGHSHSEIIMVQGANGETFVHELGHVVQEALCGNGSEFTATVNQLQQAGLLHAYIYDELLHIDTSVSRYDSNRQFPESYGARNALEHWATMFEDLLVRRGIVIKGDPDWGTPYHTVQSAMIRDIENQFPGFINYLTKITALLRMDVASPFNTAMREGVPKIYFLEDDAEALQNNMNVTLDAYKSGFLSLYYLNNAKVVYNEGPSSPNSVLHSIVINNPLLVEDSYGRIFFAYTIANGALNEKPTIKVIPHDPEKTIILDNGGMVEVRTDETDTVSYLNNINLAVNGQQVAYIDHTLVPDNAIDTYVRLLQTTTYVSPTQFNELLDKNRLIFETAES